MRQSATTCLSYQLVSSMGVAGLLIAEPEPSKPSMDDMETDGGEDLELVFELPPEPPALEDVEPSVMRAQYQNIASATLELQVKEPEYEYGFDKQHGKAWRMRILGGKKRGPTEWSCPPSLDDRGPHAPVRCTFADGDVFESGLVTQESCLRSILNLNPSLRCVHWKESVFIVLCKEDMHRKITKP